MKKTKVVMISVVLALSLGTAVQFGVFNAIGNGAMSFFDGIFPNNVGTKGSSSAGSAQYLNNPGYQGSQKISFDYSLQNTTLNSLFNTVDNGFTQKTLSTASIPGYTYFDFESGITSTSTFTTADFYWDVSGNQWSINPVNHALAKSVGVVPLNSVDANTYLSTKLSKNDIKGNPPTWKVVNDTVFVWQTAEGNALKMRLDYFANPLLITYDQISFISVDGNQNFLAQATANGWPGNGTASNPIIIENNNFTSNQFGAVSIFNTNLHFVVKNNFFNGLGSNLNGVVLQNATNGQFTGNTIENYGIGVLGVKTSSLSFDGNTISGNAQQGVSIQQSSSVTFTNNKVSNNGESGFLAYKTTLLVLASNTFTGNSLNVVNDPTILSGAISLVYSTGSMSGNTISANSGYGILLFGADSSIITSNTITGSSQAGIYVLGTNKVNISSNTIDSNVEAGISVSSSTYVTVTVNTVTSNGQDGIHWINSWYGSIQDNTLVSNSNLALVYAKTGNLKVLSTYSGIFLDPSNFNTISNNNISLNGLGVYVLGSGFNILTKNSITNNAQNGLSLINSSSNIVSTNQFVGNNNPTTYLSMSSYLKPGSLNVLSTYSGIFLDPSYNNTIENNAITNNYGYGVHISSSEYNYFESNIVSGNGFDGAFIENSNWNTITKNTFSQNSNPTYQSAYLATFKPSSLQVLSTYSGIFLDPSANNTISQNVLDSNYGNGMQLSSSESNTIYLNEMTNNAGNGLFVENSNSNNFQSNTITGNGNPALLATFLSYGKPSGMQVLSTYSGIFLDPSNYNSFKNNTLANNYGYGTTLYSSNNNLFDHNTITGNGADGVFVNSSNYNSITNNVISANSNPNLQLQLLNVMNNYKTSSTNSVNVLSTYSGIFLDPSFGNTISNNKITNNPGYGIWAQSSNNNIINSNTISNSGLDGFFLQDSSFNNVTSNNIHNSGDPAVLASFMSYGKPANLQVLSTYSGIFLDPSFNNYIAYNNVSYNTGYGIQSLDSNYNTYGFNQISYNTQQGIYSVNSSDASIMGNSFAYNTYYGTYMDSNSHSSHINQNDFIGNAQSLNDSQAFDNGGNSYDGNFLLDANPNTAYTIAGSSGSTDPNPSYVPIGNLDNYKFPPIAITVAFTTVSFNIFSTGQYMDAHLYFPSGYSAYLTNSTTVYAVWNGHYYPMLYYNVQSTSTIHVKFDRQAFEADIYAYFLQNGLTSATLTVTFTGEFNGGFMAFHGSDTTYAFT